MSPRLALPVLLMFALVSNAAPLSEVEKASHALNRLGYGSRPGEAARVAETGTRSWMEAQLSPEKIADAKVEGALAGLENLQLDAATLVKAYQDEIRRRQQAQRAGEEARPMEPMEMQDRLLVAETLGELLQAKLVRAVLSERQLQEVLTDFWFNHFNVDARKQQVRALVMPYERDVIRPHVFGEFRDLLGAVASSGAMLVYLDNWRSSREYTPDEREQQVARRLRREMGVDEPQNAQQMRRGLNENYGRELLELHTLGVDAGYSQKDVQEAARAFTGWTLDPRSGAFTFRARWHDSEAKRILGLTLPAGGGQSDGEKLLDYLTRHPATSQRIALKLCQRFVSDDPPADYVERVAQAFRRTGGDLAATYRALFLDAAFFDPANVGAKIKSPFEFVASALRATGAEFTEPAALRGRLPLRALEAGLMLGRGEAQAGRLPRKSVMMHLGEMGQPPFAFSAPTGYPEDSSTWVSAGALVARLNFALALTSGQVMDARTDARTLAGEANPDDAAAVVDALSRSILGRAPSEQTRTVLLAQAADGMGAHPVPELPKLAALLVGSPEFQRR